MHQEIIHVYLMPGMAASPKIFEYIKLPENQFKIHYLEWIMPFDDELLSDYAFRVSRFIKHENVVLLGVSFGGVLVQEISKLIKVSKLIIVSSVKSIHEIPKHMLLAKTTKAYKLVPTQLASNIDVLAKYAFGDVVYLSWAIKNMVCWNQESPNPEIIHIHGDNDVVFPIKNISNCISINKGTHIMIINKYKWFNEHLPNIILND